MKFSNEELFQPKIDLFPALLVDSYLELSDGRVALIESIINADILGEVNLHDALQLCEVELDALELGAFHENVFQLGVGVEGCRRQGIDWIVAEADLFEIHQTAENCCGNSFDLVAEEMQSLKAAQVIESVVRNCLDDIRIELNDGHFLHIGKVFALDELDLAPGEKNFL